MTEFDCPEVTLCGWQDVKIQLLCVYNYTLVHSRADNVLPLKPGVGQNIATQALPSARSFSLTQFLPSQSIHLYFFQIISQPFNCICFG